MNSASFTLAFVSCVFTKEDCILYTNVQIFWRYALENGDRSYKQLEKHVGFSSFGLNLKHIIDTKY